jgi:hypothetical protein
MRLLGFTVFTLFVTAPVSAQPGWFDLPVPTASLTQIEITLEQGRTLAASRAIHLLHASPREGELPVRVVEFEQLLIDLDAVEQESSRAGARGLSLEMAKNSSERDVLRDSLQTMGLDLRERRGSYSVELKRDGDAVKLRKRLDVAGIDTTALEKALNAGETVRPLPMIVELPSPLPHDVWESTIFERKIPPRSLFSAIVRDRHASLLFYGLLSMTPETRAYLAKDRELLRRLYRDVPGTVAAFGSSFRLGGDGRLVVPGGADAVELWEALADEKLAQTAPFANAIFSRSSGRLAYMFDAIAHLDEPHQRFALGLWIKDRGIRLDRFRALYRAFADIEPPWVALERPFSRPLNDPATMLGLVEVSPAGEPGAPSYRRFWDRALAGIDVPSSGTRELKDVADDGVVDAAWLAERVLQGLSPQRQERLGCFAFGQRVFASAREEELEDVLVAIRACGRFPGLVMTLDRAGVRRPAAYALAARRAIEIEKVGDATEAVSLLAQFQGTLVLLERMSRTGAIPSSAIDDVVSSLCTVGTSSGRYDGALAAWFEATLFPALPPLSGAADRPLETNLLRALADRAEASAPFEWEGGQYIADVSGASLRDLVAVRAKQGGNSLDTVLALARALAPLQKNSLTLDALKTQTAALKAAGDRLIVARPWPDIPDDVPDVKKIVDRAVRDLGRISKPNDQSKVPRIVAPLAALVDYLLGETIVAMSYAPHLGDPRDLLGPETDESHRHNFGLTSKPGAPAVAGRAWQRPNVDTAAKDGRALAGSLFGLDLTLSRKRLRRLALDGLPHPPRINANDSAALVDALALINPRTLTSDDLASIAQSIASGRDLVRAATDAPSLDRLAAQVSMSENRRELLGWMLQQEPARVATLFSTSEMFWLGLNDRRLERLDSWGTSFEPQSGCYCLRFPTAGTWDRVAGRLGGRLLGAAVPDLTLRVAEHLAALKVPVALLPGVMTMATQDFIDGATPIYDDDWLGIVGHAGQVPQETVQDYVAALVAAGPVRPATREAQR